jgi:hypothetical protein
MPLDGTMSDVDLDFEILETIGRHVDGLVEGCVEAGAPMKTLRRWFLGHREPPEDFAAKACLVAMTADLELFTPSMSGKTAVDRYLSARRPGDAGDREAFDALAAAQFRLVRIIAWDGPDLVRLRDLVTQENLVLLHSKISPQAAGSATAMRLCPLPSGRHVLISPLFAVDEARLAAAMTFARSGRPLGHGHRCAASLYRDVARQGFMPLPTYFGDADEEDFLAALDARLSDVERLALRWIATDGAESDEDLIGDIRQAASVDNLVDACGCFGQAGADAPSGLTSAFERIAEILTQTIVQRAQVGLGAYADALDRAGAEISRFVAQGDMSVKAHSLFERLRTRWSYRASAGQGEIEPPAAAEFDRVIQRIRALRAKTVDHGCTEQEAMAATAKIAELLDRYDLTLDAISVRKATCEGVGVDTGRRRRAPVDSCNPPIADFCDCRVWAEQTESGALRYIFFGLKADVEAARLLHDLIDAAFETETRRFRDTPIYLTLRGGDRRTALNSFQIGLANGISAKLRQLKDARRTATPTTTGFDLVVAKHLVLDEEIEKLGLNFTTRTGGSRRMVHGDAYEAGKTAGHLFEPEAALAR